MTFFLFVSIVLANYFLVPSYASVTRSIHACMKNLHHFPFPHHHYILCPVALLTNLYTVFCISLTRNVGQLLCNVCQSQRAPWSSAHKSVRRELAELAVASYDHAQCAHMTDHNIVADSR